MKCFKAATSLLIFALLWLGSNFLFAQTAKNVALADFISAEDLYLRTTPFPFATEISIGGIWGWSYNGKDYALICLINKNNSIPGSGLALVNITDPNRVWRVKTIKRKPPFDQPIDNGPYEVKVFSTTTLHYAYVCQDNSATYYVNLLEALADTTDPDRGVEDFVSASRIHNLQVCAGNSTLWLSDLALNSSILVYDIRTGNPVYLSSIPIPPGPPPSQNRRSHDLYVTGSRIYSASNDQGINIFDYTYNGTGGPFNYSNTRNHFYNARRDQAPNNFSSSPLLPIAHNVWPSTNGNYLFGTDERNGNDTLETSGTRQLGTNLRVWNIGNIDTPPDANGYRYPISKAYQAREITEPTGTFASSFLGKLPSGEFGNSIHNVHIKNESGSDLAYISHYTKGLRILDVTTPTSATELGWYDVPNVWPYIFKVYAGSWGVYPYFSSGAIIVSDARGLYVFRRATEKSGTISSSQTWSGTIIITNSITVNSNATLTISPGTTVAFADGKSLTVNAGAKIIADGTSTQTIKFISNSHPPARAKINFSKCV